MTDQTQQQEQAAPVDWQAIAKQRETELKQVGEARHLAEAELARLREGEEDSYDPRTVPTPGQWIHQFNQAPAAKRLEVVAATIEAAEKGSTCFLMAHEKRLAAAEAAIARIRTFAERARDHTAVGVDDYQIGQHDLAVDLLTALDGTSPEGTDATPAEPATRARYEQAIARVESSGPQPAPAATEATSAPDTITDPEWLRQQYTAVIRCWWDADDGGAEEIAKAVLAVRDRHLQQLRQRLALAAELAGTIQAAKQRYAAEQDKPADDEVSVLEQLGYHAMGQALDLERVEQQRDQLATLLTVILAEFRNLPGTHTATAHIETETLNRWRAPLDQTATKEN